MITRSQTLSRSTSMSASTTPHLQSHLMTTRSQHNIHKPTLLPDDTPKYPLPQAFIEGWANYPPTDRLPNCHRPPTDFNRLISVR
jgi:hypothetical protein